MNPNIMKLLEDDEDDTMHSGADVEAFAAALNRDIEGETSTSQPSESDAGIFNHKSNSTPNQVFTRGQDSNQEVIVENKGKQDQNSSDMEMMQHVSGSENQERQVGSSQDNSQLLSQQEECQQQRLADQKPCDHFQTSEQRGLHWNETSKIQPPENPHQDPTLRKLNNEQTSAAAESITQNKQVSFGMLLPVVRPHLAKDRDMQLMTLYSKLRKNEIHRDVFVRNMRNIVGDQMLKQAVNKLKMQQIKTEAAQNSQNIPHQIQVQSQTSSQQQQHVKMPSLSASQFTDSRPFLRPHQKGQNGPTDQRQIPNAMVEVKSEFSCPTKESNVQKGESETQSASQRTHVNQGSSSSITAVNQKRDLVAKQGLNEKQNLHLPQTSYPMYGANMSNYHPHPYSGQSVGASSTSLKPQSRDSQTRQLPVHPQVPSITTSLGPGTNVDTPYKKPLIGQKKPLDAPGMTSPLASKKQKVSGVSLDQSLEQLNDVTTVSGVDLREEEEQLFSGSKEENRASEATRRVVQEEEERLILQKIPFQKKMEKIMSKCGIKNISKDVEHCLSLCLEERMRGVISNLIRVSKQRVDIERSRHRTIITSDIRRQILAMNRSAKEDWEKKQAAEAEKLRKMNEADASNGADGEKDESRSKTVKGNKDVDDKMKTTAANVAARVAVGGDDMLSKWQLMAEQARQKREGVDSATGKDVTHKMSSTYGRTSTETRDGAKRKFQKNPVIPHTKVVRTVSVKDVVSVLEREPQMSKSILLYRLYARDHAADAST